MKENKGNGVTAADVLLVLGMALICAGFWLLGPLAGLLASGAACLVLAALLAPRDTGERGGKGGGPGWSSGG